MTTLSVYSQLSLSKDEGAVEDMLEEESQVFWCCHGNLDHFILNLTFCVCLSCLSHTPFFPLFQQHYVMEHLYLKNK